MTLSWSDPGGATPSEGAIVVMKAGSDPSVGDEIPVDGVEYAASSVWGSAPAIGAGGAKVVFAGGGNSVNVTGLDRKTDDPPSKLIPHHKNSMGLQPDRFAAK